MLQLVNKTPFQCALSVFANPDGVECAYAAVKATFTIKSRQGPRLADEQLPVRMKDEHYGDPAASSIRYAAEASLAKPSTDVLLLGHAYARPNSPAMVDVGLRVGPVVRVVR